MCSMPLHDACNRRYGDIDTDPDTVCSTCGVAKAYHDHLPTQGDR